MINKTVMIIIGNIQRGDKTQNQDQPINPVSFSAMNRIVNNPMKPIPLDDDELLLDTDIFFNIFDLIVLVKQC